MSKYKKSGSVWQEEETNLATARLSLRAKCFMPKPCGLSVCAPVEYWVGWEGLELCGSSQCARYYPHPMFISTWMFLSLAKVFISCLHYAGVGSHWTFLFLFWIWAKLVWWGWERTDLSSYCLLSTMISLLKTSLFSKKIVSKLVPSVPKESSFPIHVYLWMAYLKIYSTIFLWTELPSLLILTKV